MHGRQGEYTSSGDNAPRARGARSTSAEERTLLASLRSFALERLPAVPGVSVRRHGPRASCSSCPAPSFELAPPRYDCRPAASPPSCLPALLAVAHARDLVLPHPCNRTESSQRASVLPRWRYTRVRDPSHPGGTYAARASGAPARREQERSSEERSTPPDGSRWHHAGDKLCARASRRTRRRGLTSDH